MYERILVGTDGSETARLAVAHAAALASSLGAELIVATAHAGGSPARAPGQEGNDPRAAIARALLRDAVHAHGSAVSMRTIAVAGPPAQALVDLSASAGADLVVVGNRGMGRAAWAPLSSVPDRVSHRSAVSVLIVDTVHSRPPGYGRVLVGTDGSPSSAVAVAAAVELSGRLGAHVTAATAAPDEAAAAGALGPIRARWPVLETVAAVGPPAAALCNLAESGRYDLLVVGNRGIGGPRRLLGSVPDRVAHQARTSVLIVSTG